MQLRTTRAITDTLEMITYIRVWKKTNKTVGIIKMK